MNPLSILHKEAAIYLFIAHVYNVSAPCIDVALHLPIHHL
jgi:hypothetical protein